jgi:hypothetical protein
MTAFVFVTRGDDAEKHAANKEAGLAVSNQEDFDSE